MYNKFTKMCRSGPLGETGTGWVRETDVERIIREFCPGSASTLASHFGKK